MSYEGLSIEAIQALPDTMTFAVSMRNITLPVLNLVGEMRPVVAGQTGDYVVNFAVSNQHISILINSITGAGDITITGTSIDENSAIPTALDTEVITVDSSTNQYYQTNKKWWEASQIIIGPGISAIDYDVLVVGYTDINNQSFEILSYRLDIVSRGNSPDLTFKLIKIQDDGAKKMSIVDVENITLEVGAANQISDGLRTGGADRSYDPTTAAIIPNGNTLTFKQGDFSTYFVADENIFEAATKNEGLIIRYEAPTGNISDVDIVTLQLRYKVFIP